MSNAEFEQHSRDSRRMCMFCHGWKARFQYRGQVRADRHHTLCFRCDRAAVNRLRSGAAASAGC
jgi:hypothetical protein